MCQTKFVIPPVPAPEAMLEPLPEGVVRCFFRDIHSAGNHEDGMEFHAAGLVVDTPGDRETGPEEITVLYLNPYSARVEQRTRSLSEVVVYSYPKEDVVYWQLWEKIRAMFESIRHGA